MITNKTYCSYASTTTQRERHKKWIEENSIYLIRPISFNLSIKKSPEVIGGYWQGLSGVMQFSRQSSFTSDLGCRKNGILKRGKCHCSLGGFTTLCVVEQNTLLVKRWSMSPTFTTI